MTTRTFKQFGIAFGSQIANITAKIDNTVIYQGPVTTLNESYPTLPNLDYTVTNELFTWTTDVNFSGQQTLEISIDEHAVLLLASIKANYSPVPIGNTYVQSSGPDGYVALKSDQFGNTYVNGDLVPSASIDHSTLPGLWWFQVPNGGNFVENFTVLPGIA